MEDTQATERVSASELRQASFPQALRGYDREAVHSYLERVADWVDGGAGAVTQSAPQIRSELAKVGERTAGILTAAEEAAGKLRAEAEQHAQQVRTRADEEARKARLNASQKADELIGEAEAKAEKIIDEAIVRRRHLNQAIVSLVERRDEIAVEAQRLAHELLEAVEGLRSGGAEVEEEPIADEQADETQLEPPDERETTVHDAAVR